VTQRGMTLSRGEKAVLLYFIGVVILSAITIVITFTEVTK